MNRQHTVFISIYYFDTTKQVTTCDLLFRILTDFLSGSSDFMYHHFMRLTFCFSSNLKKNSKKTTKDPNEQTAIIMAKTRNFFQNSTNFR